MTSSNHTEVFQFETSTKVRTFLINGAPWFVAQDVCTALKIKNTTQAIERLDNDERSMFNIGLDNRHLFDSRVQEINIISWSGLFTIILRCRDAVTPGTIPYRFRRWVTSEVLPALIQTGYYAMPGTKPETLSDLAGTKRELVAADKATQVVQSFMPAILEAMKQQEQKYSYPAKPGYREFIHSPEGVTGLAERSYLMNLLRELEKNGNDVGGAMMEFTTMVNYITSSYRSIREIQTHAEFIVKQAKVH